LSGGPPPAALSIEIVYAEAERCIVAPCRLSGMATVADALFWAAADPRFAGIDLGHTAVGIFGRVVARTQALVDGDRVELYRPLCVDPKSARRHRAQASGARGGAALKAKEGGARGGATFKAQASGARGGATLNKSGRS
jgi:putative ubiquitin-RnfH superfamily antitoxin RatB of RatAB toxin-antitoxin module